jgi:hypothetical protein
MNVLNRSPRRLSHPVLTGTVLAMLAACAVTDALAQSSQTQPGNLVIERDVTPRDAFVPVPKDQDPIAVQVQTFPSGAFDGAIGSMASDLDLNGAHGTAGVAGSNFMPSLVGPRGVAQMLAGNRNDVPVGAGASVGGIGGIGSSIAQTVTGALAPLGGAIGAMK